jgi:3-hydroxyacyl-[acyl-carrier-protein] dehydratase
MASTLFMSLDGIDLARPIASREEIYAKLPHRFEFMQLDAIVHVDREAGLAVGLRRVREDEFWVRGHIPGMPLFPGVLMLETAAQMASYVSQLVQPGDGFLAFGGLDNVKFRMAVTPPATMFIILKMIEVRPRRTVCDVQGVVDGKLVFEARITGLPLKSQAAATNAS